ncbi:MAG: CopG family antitoxin [Dehalococcoidia bacterium]|nr:CopG family antitoxin [Dehalococcoidia bacterium]
MARLPKFKNEPDLAELFETHDSTEYFEEMTEETAPIEMIRPRKQQIAIRLDPSTIDMAKQIARNKGIGYQTLMRTWINEAIESESKKAS